MACDYCGPALGSDPCCPEHGHPDYDAERIAAAATDRAEDDSGEVVRDVPLLVAHYRDAESKGEAAAMYREEHLCGQCGHAQLCRFRPEADPDAMIVVSRCRFFARP